MSSGMAFQLTPTDSMEKNVERFSPSVSSKIDSSQLDKFTVPPSGTQLPFAARM